MENVRYTTAKLAKEKGFTHLINHPTYNGEEWESNWVETQSTQSDLQTWLRNIHDIHVNPVKCVMSSKYSIDIQRGMEDSVDFYKTHLAYFNSYEKALEKGLFAGLKLIK